MSVFLHDGFAWLCDTGRTATLSFEDYNYERALVNRLVEVVTQRDRLVEMMDEQNKRKKALAHTSQSEILPKPYLKKKAKCFYSSQQFLPKVRMLTLESKLRSVLTECPTATPDVKLQT